jgi:hypothetical protein
MHIFEYEGETLYMRFMNGLIDATVEVAAKIAQQASAAD